MQLQTIPPYIKSNDRTFNMTSILLVPRAFSELEYGDHTEYDDTRHVSTF